MSQEFDNSAFENAYLQALAASERPKSEHRKPRDKKSKPAPNFRFDTVTQFRRENSDEMAEQIAAQIAAETGRIIVRRPTIHIEPASVRAEDQALELERKALIGRLKNRAVRMGRSWSGWINDGRTSGWRHLDPALTNAWADLMVATAEHPLDTRLAIIENFVEGMKLNLDETNIYANPTKFDNDRNRVDYAERVTARVDEMSQLAASTLFRKGTSRIGLAIRGIRTGGFLCLSFEHLSGYQDNTEQFKEFRGFMMTKYKEIGFEKPFTARIGRTIISDWIGRDDVRAYFQRPQA